MPNKRVLGRVKTTFTAFRNRLLLQALSSVAVLGLVRAALLDVLPFRWEELPIEALVVPLATVTLEAVRLGPVLPQVLLLQRIRRIETGEARTPLLTWLQHELDGARQGFHELRGRTGWRMDPITFNGIMKRLATMTSAPYVGITADMPSTFIHRYRWFLESADRHRRRAAKGTMRIVIASPDDLIRDRSSDVIAYDHFFDTHKDRDINLYRIDHSTFSDLNETYELGCYLTYWDSQFAILLDPNDDFSEITVRLVLPRDLLFPIFETYKRALKEYIDNGKIISLPESSLPSGDR